MLFMFYTISVISRVSDLFDDALGLDGDGGVCPMFLQDADGADAGLVGPAVDLQQAPVHPAGPAPQRLLRVQQLVGGIEGHLAVRQNVGLAVGRGAGQAGADRPLLPARADVAQHVLPVHDTPEQAHHRNPCLHTVL